MLYAKTYGLKPGDQIVESLTSLGLAKHFAMYLGWDKNGVEWIAENKKHIGVQVITADEYFKSVLSIARFEKFSGNNIARRIAVEKALRSVGKPYDLISFNCEHFITEITTGKATSKQIQVASGVILFLALITLFD